MIPAIASKKAAFGREAKCSSFREEDSTVEQRKVFLKLWLFPIAFGNQTISSRALFQEAFKEEIHGFASPPRGRFAFIVCNRLVKIKAAKMP